MAAQANAIDRTRRMLSLFKYMRERPGAHVADVARAFGVSEAELISDLDVLPLCGTSFRGGDLLDIDTDGDRIWWHNPDDVAAPPPRPPGAPPPPGARRRGAPRGGGRGGGSFRPSDMASPII
ncbi:hypothetical protein ACFV3O_32835, partial [Streptomyces albidoflavus]